MQDRRSIMTARDPLQRKGLISSVVESSVTIDFPLAHHQTGCRSARWEFDARAVPPRSPGSSMGNLYFLGKLFVTSVGLVISGQTWWQFTDCRGTERLVLMDRKSERGTQNRVRASRGASGSVTRRRSKVRSPSIGI